ncbi:flavin reductase family protein [Nannocystaceae bacterium ST9]
MRNDHELPAGTLKARDVYRLMTSLVTPRPIAWVSTIDEEGRGNLAPFSYYQAVCSAPPTIVLSIGRRGDGSRKDTLANVLATGELTINHVSHALAGPMNASSVELPHAISEWDTLEIARAPAKQVAPARVAEALAGLECRLTHAIPLGVGPSGPSSTLVIAEVVHFWAREGLIQRDERGHLRAIDPAALDAIGRLGGDGYATTRERFDLARPELPAGRPSDRGKS